ncbi:MFS transporter [Pedobacter punctiformis]|uniref:MFS transporter n=1 Tax=Pedobacter punctiformis TaxID=3004097 RepID=A0ABT4LBM0_9SPHI|nr:MFS transporter [Pedobacter sp. HCMS5-2]MCZ4245299.1 MFS transporter [Pedobacter sp. HCMS5-2]
MRGQVTSAKIPFAIWALTFCAFGIGTTEFVIVGLLPTIANDLSISISSAGLLVTLYALGVAIGGPVFTVLTGKIERKKLLHLTIAVFIIGNTIAFFANNIILLQLSRVITGTTHGVFFAYAVIIASNMVTENKRATAISLVFAGLMISTVIGVPLGTYIGSHYGWKMTFLAVVIWGILGLLILGFSLGKQAKPTETLKLKDLPKVLKNSSVLMVLLSNIFAYTGTFVLFTYLSPVLKNITGFSLDTINFILLIFGVGVALGNITGGRISNRKPSKTLVYLFLFHAIMLFILSFVLTSKPIVIITLLLFGFFAYSNVPALQLLVVKLSERKFPGSGGIASALNVSAFNIGAASGSFIGGLVADSTLTLQATPWIGGFFVIVALGLGVLNWQRDKSTEE